MSSKKHPLEKRTKHFLPEQDKDNDYRFLDEFVYKKEKDPKLIPNVPPNKSGNFVALDEVVGNPFKHAGQDGDKGYHLDRYARLLIDLIRDYNRALYRLRRAHYYDEHAKDDKYDMPPLDKDKPEFGTGLPSPVPTPLMDQIEDAYNDAFGRVFDMLNVKGDKLIVDPLNKDPDHPDDPLPLYVSGNVDCIRMNDYIISVRIGVHAHKHSFKSGAKVVEGQYEIREIPYSSSSHISISSAFSSYSSLTPYSSSSSWHAQP
jgi:hypothetical protein